ncbi:MAG: TraR/DksA C4-type zinc finger protein [Dehalococcoidales bacterium]
MTAKLKVLRAQLEKEKALLLEELEQLKSSANSQEERREGSPFGKREEEATEALEMEKRAALEKRIKGQMVDVEHALHKFEEGTYGNCDVCGKAIDPERLEALPQAYLCMNCKAQQAKNAR